MTELTKEVLNLKCYGMYRKGSSAMKYIVGNEIVYLRTEVLTETTVRVIKDDLLIKVINNNGKVLFENESSVLIKKFLNSNNYVPFKQITDKNNYCGWKL